MYDEDHIVVDKICESTLIDPDSKVTGIREIGDLTKAELRPSPKMMILDDPEKIPAIRRDLETLLGSALYGEIERISVGNDAEGCFKTEGINSFAQSLEIRRGGRPCGDNTNDIEMLEWAGLGVAVANAVPELKNRADYVAEARRSFGVAEAVKKFVLA